MRLKILMKKYMISTVVWFMLVLFCSYISAEHVDPSPIEGRFSIWGGLPENARTTKKKINELTYVELSEKIPRQLSLDEAFSYWLIWPVDDWSLVAPFVKRATHFEMRATIPIGTFHLGVKANIRAKCVERKEEGLLTLLWFDPGEKGALEYPLPEVFKVAVKKGILTAMQKETLDDLQKFFEQQRYPKLLREWEDFTEGTYVMYTRQNFFNALTCLYDLMPGMASDTLMPENFFDSNQRIQLRSYGHAILGKCLFTFTANKFSMQIKNCPLSQLVDRWNGGLFAITSDINKQQPKLKVDGKRQHEEVDIILNVEGTSFEEAYKITLGVLLGIQGVQLDARCLTAIHPNRLRRLHMHARR
ncbi:hypothetical protein KKC91_10720 [bacterium]|nr:hypothetical protein [bacterium]